MSATSRFMVENIVNDMCRYCPSGRSDRAKIYPSLEEAMELPPPEIADFVIQILESPADWLAGKSLNELGSFHDALMSSLIGFWWDIREPDVPKAAQVRAVEALIPFFNFLDPFCDENGTSPAMSTNALNLLDGMVYMTWDRDTLEGAVHHDAEEHLWGPIYSAMEHMLTLSSCAMQLGGLHGLGHRCFSNEEAVVPLIDRYLESGRIRMPWLREYAAQARKADVL